MKWNQNSELEGESDQLTSSSSSSAIKRLDPLGQTWRSQGNMSGVEVFLLEWRWSYYLGALSLVIKKLHLEAFAIKGNGGRWLWVVKFGQSQGTELLLQGEGQTFTLQLRRIQGLTGIRQGTQQMGGWGSKPWTCPSADCLTLHVAKCL